MASMMEAATTPMSNSDKPRMRVELKDSDLKDLSIGTKVRITTEGVVHELRAPEKYQSYGPGPKAKPEEKIEPPCMYVLVDSTKVAPVGSAQIADIVASDDAEDEYD